MKTILLSGILILCASTDGFAQSHHRQVPTKPGSETIPSIQTQTAKVLKSPTWDYMIWTDASEKKHLREVAYGKRSDRAFGKFGWNDRHYSRFQVLKGRS